MRLTNYAENAIANNVLRGVAMTLPSTWYVALHTADPTETGAVAESSQGRKAVAFNAASNGICANSADVTWDITASVALTHVTLCDAATGGNAWFYGPLGEAKTMASGEIYRLPAGNVTVGFD